MLCKNCAHEVDEKATFCIYCGHKLKIEPTLTESNNIFEKSMGVLLAIFLSIVGLIVGLLVYREDTQKREVFLIGWWIGFIANVIINVVVGLILGLVIVPLL